MIHRPVVFGRRRDVFGGDGSRAVVVFDQPFRLTCLIEDFELIFPLESGEEFFSYDLINISPGTE